MTRKLRPMSNHILLRLEEKELTSSSGIIIIETVEKEVEAIVHSIPRTGASVSVGDRVEIKRPGMLIELDGEKLYLIKESEILGIKENEE